MRAAYAGTLGASYDLATLIEAAALIECERVAAEGGTESGRADAGNGTSTEADGTAGAPHAPRAREDPR